MAFALRSTERGLTRSAMLVQDAIATAVLPNPGRSSEQRTMGVGAQGGMQYGAGANAASTARLLFLRAEPAALLKASLIASMTDPTMAVSWLGAHISHMFSNQQPHGLSIWTIWFVHLGQAFPCCSVLALHGGRFSQSPPAFWMAVNECSLSYHSRDT